MKNAMKKVTLPVMALTAMSVLMTGCFTPESMPMTQRDNEMYVDAGAPATLNAKENKATVAVVASEGTYTNYKTIADQLASSLNDRLSSFAFFQMADRSSQAALLKEKLLTSDDPTSIDTKAIEADYLVVARITSMTQYDIQFDFKWIGVESQRVVMSKSIRKTLNSINTSYVDAAVAEFSREIAVKYAPPARVLQTRGGGEAARISLGTNYGLSAGDAVCFYEIVDNTAVGGKKRDYNDIATGTVKIVEAESAWVQVNSFKEVNVRKGTYVRVVRRNKNILDSVTDVGSSIVGD